MTLPNGQASTTGEGKKAPAVGKREWSGTPPGNRMHQMGEKLKPEVSAKGALEETGRRGRRGVKLTGADGETMGKGVPAGKQAEGRSFPAIPQAAWGRAIARAGTDAAGGCQGRKPSRLTARRTGARSWNTSRTRSAIR